MKGNAKNYHLHLAKLSYGRALCWHLPGREALQPCSPSPSSSHALLPWILAQTPQVFVCWGCSDLQCGVDGPSTCVSARGKNANRDPTPVPEQAAEVGSLPLSLFVNVSI